MANSFPTFVSDDLWKQDQLKQFDADVERRKREREAAMRPPAPPPVPTIPESPLNALPPPPLAPAAPPQPGPAAPSDGLAGPSEAPTTPESPLNAMVRQRREPPSTEAYDQPDPREELRKFDAWLGERDQRKQLQVRSREDIDADLARFDAHVAERQRDTEQEPVSVEPPGAGPSAILAPRLGPFAVAGGLPPARPANPPTPDDDAAQRMREEGRPVSGVEDIWGKSPRRLTEAATGDRPLSDNPAELLDSGRVGRHIGSQGATHPLSIAGVPEYEALHRTALEILRQRAGRAPGLLQRLERLIGRGITAENADGVRDLVAFLERGEDDVAGAAGRLDDALPVASGARAATGAAPAPGGGGSGSVGAAAESFKVGEKLRLRGQDGEFVYRGEHPTDPERFVVTADDGARWVIRRDDVLRDAFKGVGSDLPGATDTYAAGTRAGRRSDAGSEPVVLAASDAADPLAGLRLADNAQGRAPAGDAPYLSRRPGEPPAGDPPGPTQLVDRWGNPMAKPSRVEAILDARGDTASLVTDAPGAAVVRADDAMPDVDARTARLMPNLAKLDPEVHATIARTVQENPDLVARYQQGRITHRELVDDLAPRLGLTAEDFLATPIGQAFRPEELAALRATLVSKTATLRQRGQEMTERGLDSVSNVEKAQYVRDMLEAAQLTAVARGGAATAGRALNQQKITMNRLLADGIAGSNDLRAAQAEAKRVSGELRSIRVQIARQEREALERAAAKAERAGRQEQARELRAAAAAAKRAEDAEMAMIRRVERGENAVRARADRADQQTAKRIDDHIAGEEQRELTRLDKAYQDMVAKVERWELDRAERDGLKAWRAEERELDKMDRDYERLVHQLEANEGRSNVQRYKQSEKMLAAMGGRTPTDEMIEQFIAVQQTGDPVAAARFLQGMHRSTLLEKAVTWTTSNMLSGPKTLGVNLAGGAIETINRPLLELMEGRPVDALTDLGAMGRAMGRAMGQARTTFTTGVQPSMARAAADAGALDNLRADTFPGRQGMLATPALRALSATDEFVREINRAGALAVAARREAKRTGKAVEEIQANPSDGMRAFAESAADRAVFRGRGTPLGRALTSLRSGVHSTAADPRQRFAEKAAGVAAYILTPFVRIPEEVLVRGSKMAIGPALYTGKAAYHGLRGEGDAARTAAAKAAMTSASAYLIYGQVEAGNITGDGPTNAEKKALLMAARDPEGNPVWRPHSVRVGGRWYDYTNLGPVSIQMAAMASAYEAARDEQRKPDATALKQLAEVAGRVGKVYMDASYLQTVGDVVKAIDEGRLDDIPGSVGSNVLSRLVPYGGAVAAASRLADDTVRDPANPVQATQARTPLAGGLSVPGLGEIVAEVAPRLGPYGEEARQPQDALSTLVPFRTEAPGQFDPVAAEVARLEQAGHRVPVALFSRNEKFAGADQAPDQRRLLQNVYGRAAQTYLLEQLADPRYAALSDKQKADTLGDALRASKRTADLIAGERVNRDVEHQAKLALASVPHYQGMPKGDIAAIRRDNLRIAQAHAKLAAFREHYRDSDRAEFELRRQDRAAFNLSQRHPRLPSEQMARQRDVIDKHYGGALRKLDEQGLLGAGQTFVGVAGTR